MDYENNIKDYEMNIQDNMKENETISMSSLLIEELKNENHNVRIFCVRKLSSLAEILGPTRTEEELVPFLIELIINFEDNEEVLCELGNEFFNLVKHLPSNCVSNILRGLELLAGNDDENVRQNATENMCKLIDILDESIITNEVFPLMQRMIQNEMKFKVSCCYIFPVVYPKLTNHLIKSELIQAFYEISRDESPAVRRAAAFNIRNFAKIENLEILKDLVSLYKDLLKDSVDIVRVFAIESTKSILSKLPLDQNQNLVRTFISSIEEDRSWRVKYAAGDQLCDLCSLYNSDFNDHYFLPLIVKFLKDIEPEVRASVLSKLPIIILKITLTKFNEQLIPIFNDILTNDTNFYVKATLASAIPRCSKYLDENTFVMKIFPIISRLLKDENIEVRHATLENLNELTNFFSSNNLVNSFVPLFNEIANDQKWRLRLELCIKISNFLEVIELETFTKFFLPIVFIFYNDHASEIREQAIKCFEKLAILQTHEWKVKFLWEKIKSQLNSNNYIFRIAGLRTVDLLKIHFDQKFFNSEIIHYILCLKIDPVPNVRLYLCKLLKSILTQNLLEEKIKNEKIRYCLELLCKDSDIDVRYYSKEALNNIINENKMNID